MSYNTNTRPPRTGVIILASVVFMSIFVIAFLDAYEQKVHSLGHTVHLSPSSANYGTIYSAPSTVAVPIHNTAPMLSGGAIRSHAYTRHSSLPGQSGTSSSGFKIHTTSSASLHSYGSGGGGGAMGTGGGSSSSSSSCGIQSSGISASIPTPTLAIPTFASNSGQNVARPRYMPSYTGYDEEITTDEDGTWLWDTEQDKWVLLEPAIGATKIEGGNTYRWNGSSWEVISNQQDPGLPLGNTPWFWMLLLAAGYAAVKMSLRDVKELK